MPPPPPRSGVSQGGGTGCAQIPIGSTGGQVTGRLHRGLIKGVEVQQGADSEAAGTAANFKSTREGALEAERGGRGRAEVGQLGRDGQSVWQAVQWGP